MNRQSLAMKKGEYDTYSRRCKSGGNSLFAFPILPFFSLAVRACADDGFVYALAVRSLLVVARSK